MLSKDKGFHHALYMPLMTILTPLTRSSASELAGLSVVAPAIVACLHEVENDRDSYARCIAVHSLGSPQNAMLASLDWQVVGDSGYEFRNL